MPGKDRLRSLKRKQNYEKTLEKTVKNINVENNSCKQNKGINSKSVSVLSVVGNQVNKKNEIISQVGVNNLNLDNQQAGNQVVQCNLIDRDMNTIQNPQGYLEDIHIDFFFSLVRSSTQFRPQCTAYAQFLDRIHSVPQGTSHIQIMFVAAQSLQSVGHWLTSYYDGSEIIIYDSMNSQILPANVTDFLERLFPYRPPVRFVRVQQQTNSYDCGLFAIAFYTSLIFNRNPEHEIYDISRLRPHLLEMFRTRQIRMFPLNRQVQLSQNYLKRRAIETEEQRIKRLKVHSEYNFNKIASETIEENTKRLGKLKFNFKEYLEKETAEQKAERLERYKNNFVNLIENETSDQKAERLERYKNNFVKLIKNETSDQKAERLERYKNNFVNLIKNETSDQKAERLERYKNNFKNVIESETIDQKAERLERNRNNFVNLVQNESLEQKQNRLAKNNEINKNKILVNKHKNKSTDTYMLASKGLKIEVEPHSLGSMTIICKDCSSKNFVFEKPYDGKFTHCCRKGKLNPDQLVDFPDYIKNLMIGNDTNSKNFKENIRKFNSALAFASMGASLSPPPGYGPYCFRIHGQIYHESTSGLYPTNGKVEKYAQLYIINSSEALDKRMSLEYNKKCKPEIMKQLDVIIRQISPYCRAYMMLKEVEEREKAKAQLCNQAVPEINLWIVSDRSKDKRRYNIPTSNEVAVVFSSNDGEPPINRDICVHPKAGGLVRINQFSENCDPMTYPLLFPRGEQGWNMNMKQADGIKKQSTLQFYMNRLAVREHFNPCLEAGKLTQQYIVDAYVKIEAERLTYIRLNQPALRVELYSGLMDHINNLAENEGGKAGTMVILPSTFQGGSRFMQKMYQNAMAIVREFGKPDLFITVTCNPKWREITEQLREGQTTSDRPDIVARVFCGKIKHMMHEFLKDDIFGKVIAYIYVIEFQKRGLPHMHLLLTLDESSKIRNKDEIDTIVCAEIPDEIAEPELYRIVQSHMIHGPCGILNKNSPCMSDNKCSKKYPKDFRNETHENINGYPLYKRSNNNAKMYILWRNGTIKYTIDNRWIVPYNPYLSKKYRTHINIEICSSVKSIKYICDYLCKGHDCASIKLGQVDKSKTVQWDEINGYLDARYVSAPECCWRLLEYPLHDKSHVIYELSVHLEYQQAVYFIDKQEKKAIERAKNKPTTLTAWFLLNQTDVNARQYRYMDIPKFYVFVNNMWKERQREKKPPIGRMISVSPRDIERFHLRLILVHAKGAISFNDLLTVDGQLYKTYQEAARALGLLANDKECENCLDEAVLSKFPKQLRELFAYLICFHTSTNALALWEKFKDYLMEDYLLHYSKEIAQNKCLRKIQEILVIHKFELSNFGLPQPSEIDNLDKDSDLYDIHAEKLEGERNVALFNSEQRKILEQILKAVNDPHCKDRYFFLDGPGGTGKTFLYNTLISILRGQGQKVISVAWTGIAATLLKGGQTVHSVFKLPVPVIDGSVCKIKANSIAGKLVKNTTVIIIDEVTMIPKHALKAIDLILKDLMNNSLPFGGKVIVLGGDFRQCLPVVSYTNHRTTIIEASVLKSHLWPLFKKYSLTQNMRVNKDEKEFAENLLKVGNGLSDIVTIPSNCISNISLADEIFGTNDIAPNDIYKFTNRAILSPKNDDTMIINEIVLNKITGPSRVYYSADSCECEESNKINYPTEVLNNQLPTGMPPYKLTLKIGAIVMLLRNMNPKRGLCNGTRLIVKDMKNNYLDLEVLTGQSSGTRIYLPRFDLNTDTNLPFTLKRRQFPIRLAFSITINKAQGQTFDFVGINLEKPVFTHGQLYVAMSRVKSMKNLKIKLPETNIDKSKKNGYTANVVFKEILN